MMRKRRWRLTILLVTLALIAMGSLWIFRRQRHSDIAQGQTLGLLVVESSSFAGGDSVPKRLTCDGNGLSPDIHWQSAPFGTKSLAIVMDDADAPLGFVHWLVYDIPAEVQDIAEGASSQGGLPHGVVEGIHSADAVGYFGPCPPGTKPHHYFFRVYALDVPLTLPPGKTKDQLAAAVKGHVLAEGKITGLYSRASQ
jgi:Raf kinase inhibitor-like YbhB/YbcL family protein